MRIALHVFCLAKRLVRGSPEPMESSPEPARSSPGIFRRSPGISHRSPVISRGSPAPASGPPEIFRQKKCISRGSPAPASYPPAPVSCPPAPASCLPAPASCLPAPASCLPAPASCPPVIFFRRNAFSRRAPDTGRFREVRRAEFLAPCQVRDRSRDLEEIGPGAGGEAKLPGHLAEKTLGGGGQGDVQL